MKTAVLLAGFGGPARPEDVRPFLHSVALGAHIPEERLKEVESHYRKVGGVSRYNEMTSHQSEALQKKFKAKGNPLEIFTGFLHSKPSFTDVFTTLKTQGFERVIVFVLSVFRSYPSFDRYHERLVEARKAVGADAVQIVETDPFHSDPLFIEAVSERVSEAVKEMTDEKAYFLFTAHSIPMDWAEKSRYAEEFEECASHVAKELSLTDWSVAYQSRSGPCHYPWLEPDVNQVIRELPKWKYTRVVLVPIGFLCDNVEVVYDLDIEARGTAGECGLHYTRALTVMDQPVFIEMMAREILKKS